MAEQGPPPGRLTRRAEDDQPGRGGAVRARRAGRPAAPQPPGWQRDAFAPDETDPDLPSWAGPAAQQVRAGGARRRPDPYTGGYVGAAEMGWLHRDGVENGE